MKTYLIAVALLASLASAHAQSRIPDLKGTWTGKGKAVVLGANAHHPGTQKAADAARVRDIEATHVVEGQDGRLAWGHSTSAAAKDATDPFVWALASDNRTIIGADADGYFRITLTGRDRMDKCYAHNGLSPSGSVVAACYTMTRKR
ncbi:MAG: hypothetical protein AB7V13_21890 [Pseudorhodoplanes sp.]|uniref:hypothetical protein n=1 Tax=Pseudorhodoplanes sp. TaxID=1934341 RepID=UPI003D1188CF